MTATIRGTAHAPECAWPLLRARFRALIPRYPGPSLVPLVRMPAPPLLRAEAPLAERAEQVARAYVGAVETRTGKRCWAFPRGASIERHKHFILLCTAALALEENGIPPAAWCAFSADVWKRNRNAKAPPVSWVLGDARIDERADWYFAEAVHYAGGALRMGEAHTALARAWSAMQRALLAAQGALDEGRVRAIVAKHCPAEWYERTVQRARAEVESEQREIRECLARNVFLW